MESDFSRQDELILSLSELNAFSPTVKDKAAAGQNPKLVSVAFTLNLKDIVISIFILKKMYCIWSQPNKIIFVNVFA